jgi:hypothetical protein
VRALLALARREEEKKRFSSPHVLPLTIAQRTMATFWHFLAQKWRDWNWHSCSSTAQYMALLIRSPGNVESSYSDRAMVCSEQE